jgi:hyaluronoglucosaminidase
VRQTLPFATGLVEGFYGRQWRDEDRIACLRFIAGTGFRYYLYAPKGDAVLRRRWPERWDVRGGATHARDRRLLRRIRTRLGVRAQSARAGRGSARP